MNTDKPPNIFGYNNFREYLKALFDYRISKDETFTKAYICKELGLPNSRSYFSDILRGKFFSPLKLPLMIKVFKLPRDEAQYFRVLVNFNQATDADEKELLLDQLISLNRTPKEILSPEVYAYYKEWYHSAIRAIINTFDFKNNFKQLIVKLVHPVTVKQAKESIELLKQLKLIDKNEAGFYKPTAKVISTGSFAKEDIIKQYQGKLISIARDAILQNHGQPQRMVSKVLSFSEDAYKQIDKKIEKFNSEITSIVHKDEKAADRVYHLNILFHPILKRRST